MERRQEIIKAARQRLALAKSHESYISKTLQSAMAAEEAAKQYRIEIELQMQQSKKKVHDAVNLLEEAEKRLELVDDDQDESAKKLVHRESNSNENGSSSKDQDSKKKFNATISSKSSTKSNSGKSAAILLELRSIRLLIKDAEWLSSIMFRIYPLVLGSMESSLFAALLPASLGRGGMDVMLHTAMFVVGALYLDKKINIIGNSITTKKNALSDDNE